jgi:hypothetical protein
VVGAAGVEAILVVLFFVFLSGSCACVRVKEGRPVDRLPPKNDAPPRKNRSERTAAPSLFSFFGDYAAAD